MSFTLSKNKGARGLFPGKHQVSLGTNSSMFHVLWLSAVYFLESLWTIATKGYQYRVDWAYADWDVRGAPCQMLLIDLKKWRLLLSSYFLLNTSGDNN